ncbi:MAG: hypothetical protein A2X64_04205 [Ignavibacteria bacterium GWF2_33_9]|nr:MAG: hypothetical protein A2X64_04205 [Ignavibacteria bacterium GWF2_33_9]
MSKKLINHHFENVEQNLNSLTVYFGIKFALYLLSCGGIMILNMFKNKLHIEIKPDDLITSIQLIDFKGKLLQTLNYDNSDNIDKSVDLDLKETKPNIYFVSVNTKSGRCYTEAFTCL